MGGAKSKRIGKTAERDIVKWLNEMFKDYELHGKPVEFRRVIGSGAHGHLVERMPLDVRVSLSGDVYGPTEWPWIIESKKRTNDSIDKILMNEKHEFHAWTEQVFNESCDFEKKSPLLIMNFGGKRKTWVAMHATCFIKLWRWDQTVGKPPRIKINVFHESLSRWEPWIIVPWSAWECIIKKDLLGVVSSYIKTSVSGLRRKRSG